MPTTYTHDLFGKEVYRSLDPKLRKIIRRHGDLYRIGLHGPDILFYYHLWKNRVNRLGSRMHRQPAAAFFQETMEKARETKEEALFAYLLGFACHHLLDSTCHPYINSVKEEVSHTVIEKELDRMLMLKTGKNPYRYYPSCCIRPRHSYAAVIHKGIPQVSTGKILKCLKLMKRYTNFMVYDDGGRKRAVLVPLLKLLKHPSLGEHLMKESCDKACLPHLRELERLYQQARKEAPQYLEKLAGQWKTPGPLPERMNLDYNGN